MERHHEQRPHRGCQEGHTGLTLLSSRNLFLAAAASSCSAESCLSFSSSWRFRTATGSPFCVACQHGGGTSVGTTTFRPIPSTPHTGNPALYSRAKFSSILKDTLRASLSENGVPSLPLHFLRLSRAVTEPYRVPGVLDDSCFLCQDLNELLGLPLTEHHAADCGHESLVGQVQGPIRIRRC